MRFNIHEIEHQGDEDNALSELVKAGCEGIDVVARDYDDEVIRVDATLPEGWTLQTLEKMTQLCL
jgi:hypothetical protein